MLPISGGGLVVPWDFVFFCFWGFLKLKKQKNEHVHNFFMTTFARGGILNFILFVYFYYQVLQKLKSSNLKQHAYTFLVPCLVMSSLDITMDGVQFPMLYYFFIGYFLQKQD
mgnify:CR=1 FL=1